MTRDLNTISFQISDRPDLIEPGPFEGSWHLTQPLKSWLVKNDVKVFVEYKEDLAVFRFNTLHDTDEFARDWSK